MLDGLPLLPDGTTLPPFPYLLAVLLAAGAVALAVRRQRPAVTGAHVLALVPWMALGAGVHVLYVVGALPPLVAPLGGSPTVYVVVGTLAASAWIVADEASAVPVRGGGDPIIGTERVPVILAAAGTTLLLPVVAAAVADGVSPDGVSWSVVAFGSTLPLTAVVWWAVRRVAPRVTTAGWVGVLTVFGHALDGVSTAIGVTQLGFGERTPLSRALLELGGLPSLPVLGEGWAFLLLKLAVATLLVHFFVPYIREEPGEGLLLLGFVAAVGLGPAVHNLLLFSVAA